MELAKLIHENQCQDESCIHCQCEFKERIVKLTSSSRRFVEMYKIACAQVIDKGKAEREDWPKKQCKNRKEEIQFLYVYTWQCTERFQIERGNGMFYFPISVYIHCLIITHLAFSLSRQMDIHVLFVVTCTRKN